MTKDAKTEKVGDGQESDREFRVGAPTSEELPRTSIWAHHEQECRQFRMQCAQLAQEARGGQVVSAEDIVRDADLISRFVITGKKKGQED